MLLLEISKEMNRHKDPRFKKLYDQTGIGCKLACPVENCPHEFIKKNLLDEHIRANHPGYTGS
jgi:hypothetical protein